MCRRRRSTSSSSLIVALLPNSLLADPLPPAPLFAHEAVAQQTVAAAVAGALRATGIDLSSDMPVVRGHLNVVTTDLARQYRRYDRVQTVGWAARAFRLPGRD